MAWVRLHDGALSHPKVIGIFDARRPFDLWMWGLSYSQAHLTDGHLPAEAIPKGVSKAVQVLVDRKLWEAATGGGYQIHDFLEWNDSKELVTKKRSEAKARMRDVRSRSSREQPANVRQSTSREVLRGLGKGSLDLRSSERELERKPTAESKWPVFKGNRLVVFEWMLTHLQRTLGAHADAMEWDLWLDEADRRAMAEPVIVADWWPWLQAELLACARLKGWAVAEIVVAGKQTTRLAAALANIKQEAQ